MGREIADHPARIRRIRDRHPHMEEHVAKQNITQRRAFVAGLGAVAAAGAIGARSAQAQGATSDSFTPTLHPQDDWMSARNAKHRVVVDVTSAAGWPDAVRFANNLLQGHKNGWGVEESDVAVIVCFRHGATPLGYNDVIWSKYGKTIDPKATPPPAVNPYNSGEEQQLAALAKRGVQFMVCGTASRGLATRIAGPGGDVEGVLKEMGANLIPSARIVPAGVVAVVHAQERRFALISVGYGAS
jgi:intracellular sulfur oxidation DsrE/DsrF family protein